MVIYRAPVIPVECGLDPVEPEPVDEIALPPLPPENAPAYAAIRAQRAELAGLYFRGVAESERHARATNAEPQRVCAAWVRSQP
jgi:hypothetical protein